MSDPVGLAGTIGTWVAVFLAIVALAGILPAYLLYKKSRTERAQALALVDDPSHTFISGGIRLPGIRLKQKIKMPDFVNSPRLQSLVSQPEPNRLWLSRSTTNWVNFAHVMMATFPSIKMIPENNLLVFENYQSYLPVQRNWILIFGILHRYAFRSDYGLPLGAALDADMEARGLKGCLSGLSGMLFSGSTRRERYDGPSKVFYEMHTIPQVQQCLWQEAMSIRVLILLFLGYVQMPNGEYFIAQTPERTFSSRAAERKNRATFTGRLRIMGIANCEVSRAHMRLIRELDLSITTIKTLKLVHPSSLGMVLPSNVDAKMMEERGFSNLGLWKPSIYEKVFNVWASRVDVYQIVYWYFSMQLSPKGILYDTAKDIIVKKVFKTEGLPKTLELAKIWLSKLDVSDEERQTVRVALDAVTESDAAEVSWSRHAMQTFYALDETIQRIWEADNWKSTSISILYACDEVFRTNLRTSLEKIEGEQYQTIKFDTPNKRIEVPDWEHLPHTHDFYFNFDHTFPGIHVIDGELSVSFAKVVFASLQGHLRAIMWKMSLSPRGLEDFYEGLEETSYVGTYSAITTFNTPRRNTSSSVVSTISERSSEERSAAGLSIESVDDRPRQYRWEGEQYGFMPAPARDPHRTPPWNVGVPLGPQGGVAYPMADLLPRFPAPQPYNYPLPPHFAYPTPAWYPTPPATQRPGAFRVGLDSRNDSRVYNREGYCNAFYSERPRSIG